MYVYIINDFLKSWSGCQAHGNKNVYYIIQMIAKEKKYRYQFWLLMHGNSCEILQFVILAVFAISIIARQY